MCADISTPFQGSIQPAGIQSSQGWYFSNPNVDHSAPPRPATKKEVKKAPSKKPRKNT